MVYEMHNGDIRSCLNALQMLSRDGGHVDVAKLRTVGDCVRDCNMSSGLFDVWNATFKLAAKQDQKQGVKHMDLHKLLNFHSSSMTTILLGCQHNFPKVKYTDPRMLKTSACLESLGDADVMHSYINQHQSYSLSPYLKIPCLKFHHLCAAPQWPSIEYPRAASEPDIKVTNMHLMSAEHRQRIQDHVSIMLTFGLRYRPQTQDNGKAELAMQPPIEDLVKNLSKNYQNALKHELMTHIEQLVEIAALKKREERNPKQEGEEKQVSIPANFTTPPTIKNKTKVFGNAGWASLSQHAASKSHLACSNSDSNVLLSMADLFPAHPVKYKFTEGMTNAIKRPVFLRDLL
ncbi:hypothetical protein GUITHDRAFT_99293 [Guillardia theta CCMP2712]|uniref:Uncharacterized protein n=1 Tax=Guillardia theta (strain CCMP2712) TaxID=905079 RepID=L1K4J7_GUITC|nr:hypothetical protein GUITHDRAFT_99293 [Guillardia theta CCMP2712]EKX55517.1 hypothetical protein GUITHDRAFT_99293 [Guillardia theta CCMP2712]|eukprot:XP_005842497.1 hypothetical protein GUITHDRAFT_99293 [Guillardia theta CCMP2712]